MQNTIFSTHQAFKKTFAHTPKYWSCLVINIVTIFLITTIAGCKDQQTWQTSSDDYGSILIGQTTVTLTPKHILSIKSEQYQPSLTLFGRILPQQQVTLTAPITMQLSQMVVTQAQIVKKDDPLFTLTNLNRTLPNAGVAQNITAPFDGRITQVYYKNTPTLINARASILKMETPNQLKFIGLLPAYTKSRLSVGQHVNFVLNNPKPLDKNESTSITQNNTYTGQVSEIVEIPNSHKIAVHVHVLADDDTPPPPIGANVQGKLDYGQLEVGTLVKQEAVHGSGLSVFTQLDSHVTAPVKAHVWIVNQDSTLSYQPVEVIRYNDIAKQYLVSGIPSESLIIIANLPKTAQGKRLKIS